MSQQEKETQALIDALAEEAKRSAASEHPEHPEHPDIDELFAYHAGALDAAQAAQVQNHLVSCRPCTARLLEIEPLAQPETEARDGPTDMGLAASWRGLQSRIAAEDGKGRRFLPPRVVYSVAASLLVAVVGLSVWIGILGRASREPGPDTETHIAPPGATPVEPDVRSGAPDTLSPDSGGTPSTGPAAIASLSLDQPVEQEIAPGESHRYLLSLAAGEFLHIDVDQRNVDLAVTLFDPEGNEVLRADRPIAGLGIETLEILALAAGTHLLELLAFDGDQPPGSYRARVEALRPATGEDRLAAQAAELFYQGESLRRESKTDLAIESYQAALSLWQRLDSAFRQGEAWFRIGNCHEAEDRWSQAAQSYRHALELFQQAGNERWQAVTQAILGRGSFAHDDIDSAIEHHLRAASLWRTVGDRFEEAQAHHNLGQAYQVRGEVGQALGLYERALDLWPRGQDRRADTLHNLGVLYRSQGKTDLARDRLQQAIAIYARSKNRAEAASHNQLGRLYRQQGDLDRALLHHRRALDLRRNHKAKRGEAAALSEIGQLHQLQDRPEEARRHYEAAQEILRDIDRPRSRAKVERYLGSLYIDLGEPERAADAYRKALSLHREIGDPSGEAATLLGMARAWHLQGHLAASLEATEEALDIVETLRSRSLNHDLRGSYLASVEPYFDFHIKLLMEIHTLHPTSGYDALALQASERARARSLLDLLAEAGSGIDTGVDDPRLLERKHALHREIAENERRRLELRELSEAGIVRSNLVARHLDGLEASQRELLARLDQLKADLRQSSPRYAALTRPQLLSLAQIQALLDEETLLLSYELGDERSFLWVVAAAALHSFELPGRSEIEELARQAYERLALSWKETPDDEGLKSTLCRLSEQVLGPAAALLGEKRLLIVADGALHYIPFAALADPATAGSCASPEPLLVHHEITRLPSASTLAVLRRELESRRPAPKLLAVVADPVYTRRDPRLENGLADGPPQAGTAREEDAAVHMVRSGGDLKRLSYSLREARSILSVVPPGEASFLATDFEANKETVQHKLSGFRVVHFATHGWFDPRVPGLSGLVLSRFDERGRPRDGFLRAYEIFDLKLDADLVVLAACKTALGPEIAGEGLLGLSRGFLYAGAGRVMVSLWNVGDRSAAELMPRFYRRMLSAGLAPAAALREAQLSMLGEKRWQSPYHWAGFVIQGEWK